MFLFDLLITTFSLVSSLLLIACKKIISARERKILLLVIAFNDMIKWEYGYFDADLIFSGTNFTFSLYEVILNCVSTLLYVICRVQSPISAFSMIFS